MLTDAVRRRLEALNRQSLGSAATLVPTDAVVSPSADSTDTVSASDTTGAPSKLGGATRHSDRRHVRVVDPLAAITRVARPQRGWFATPQTFRNTLGEHWRLQVPLEQLWGRGTKQLQTAQRHRRQALKRSASTPHPELTAFLESFPAGALFLDLETCGFAGSPIFLIGLLHQIAGQWQVDLLLARSYAEEPAILATLWQIVAEHQVLVTFNGKSFDWPMVHDRSTMHHLGRDRRGQRTSGTPSDESLEPADRASRVLARHEPRPELVHFDLLHHARRRWRHKLPNCRLQTLESYVCGRRREGDIPGSQIPAAYHHYVRTGETRDMESVLHHNAVDLVTLMELSLRIGMD